MSIINSLRNLISNQPVRARAAAAPAQPERNEPRDRVEISSEARAAYTPPDDSSEFVGDVNKDRTDQVKLRQERTIQTALGAGERPFVLRNSAGQDEVYRLSRGETDGAYQLQGQGGPPLRVFLDEQMSPEDRVKALASVSDFHSRIPPHLRDAVEQITVSKEPYPTRHGHLEGYARRDAITIYDGLTHIDNGVLDHEFGHALGYQRVLEDERRQASSVPIPGVDTSPSPISALSSKSNPFGWRGVIRADGRAPSQYARDGGPAEDFAESYVAYREAQEEGPQAVEALRQLYPARVGYLEEMLAPPQSSLTPFFDALREWNVQQVQAL